MNHDEKNHRNAEQLSAEMEMRVLAWVCGEATPEEAAALALLAAAQPAIAAFKRQVEGVQRLAAEAVAPEAEPLRLSAGRRAELLRALSAGGPALPAPGTAEHGVAEFAALQRRHRQARRWMLAVAACLTVGLFLTATLPSLQKSRGTASLEKAVLPSARRLPPAGAEYYFNDAEGAKQAAPSAAAPTTAGNEVLALAAPTDALTPRDEAPSASPASSEGANSPIVARPEVESEPPAVRSPFVVDASQDQGSYRANSTLAGTRVRTDLKDVSSAVTVVTRQFLEEPAQKKENAFDGPVNSLGMRNAGDPTLSMMDAPADFGVQDSAVVAAPSPSLGLPGGPALGGTRGVAMGSGSPEGIPIAAKPAPDEDGPGEVRAAVQPLSTFSLHVSDVSFRLARTALARGELPDGASIRPEEFYNAFRYGDPAPSMAEKISCHTEQAADPVKQQRNLLRIALRVPTTGHPASQPLRLTVLLDTSGSMMREDRAAAVQSAMKVLVSLLGRDDRVTLVGFARHPRLLAEQVPGDRAASLLDMVAKTPPDGGTNLEEALALGGELALRQFSAGAQNRVVVLTDGVTNLGDEVPEHLAAQVEKLRQRDVAFDACGVGSDGIGDAVLEALTRKGSGRYYLIDSPIATGDGFAQQIAGAFRPAAENVKVQVKFNPDRVGNYRLIGFENHRLNAADFLNDQVAAAALAGGEAAVALYEVEALPQGEGDVGEVYVRFRDTATGTMVERSWTLPYEPYAPSFDHASPALQLAGAAALLAEKLRGGERADAIKLEQLAPIVTALRGFYPHEAQVQALATMFQQLRRIRGE